jgi:hypothetical protein
MTYTLLAIILKTVNPAGNLQDKIDNSHEKQHIGDYFKWFSYLLHSISGITATLHVCHYVRLTITEIKSIIK